MSEISKTVTVHLKMEKSNFDDQAQLAEARVKDLEKASNQVDFFNSFESKDDLKNPADYIRTTVDYAKQAVTEISSVFSTIGKDISKAFSDPMKSITHDIGSLFGFINKTSKQGIDSIDNKAMNNAVSSAVMMRLNAERAIQTSKILKQNPNIASTYAGSKEAVDRAVQYAVRKSSSRGTMASTATELSQSDSLRKSLSFLGELSDKDLKDLIHLSSLSTGQHMSYTDYAKEYGKASFIRGPVREKSLEWMPKIFRESAPYKGEESKLSEASVGRAGSKIVEAGVYEELKNIVRHDKSKVLERVAVSSGLAKKNNGYLDWAEGGQVNLNRLSYFAGLLAQEHRTQNIGSKLWENDPNEKARINKTTLGLLQMEELLAEQNGLKVSANPRQLGENKDKIQYVSSKDAIRKQEEEIERMRADESFSPKQIAEQEKKLRDMRHDRIYTAGTKSSYVVPMTYVDKDTGKLIVRDENEVRQNGIKRQTGIREIDKETKFVTQQESNFTRDVAAAIRDYKPGGEVSPGGFMLINTPSGKKAQAIIEIDTSAMLKRDSNGQEVEDENAKKQYEQYYSGQEFEYGDTGMKYKYAFQNGHKITAIASPLKDWIENVRYKNVESPFDFFNVGGIAGPAEKDVIKQINNVRKYNTPTTPLKEMLGLDESPNVRIANWGAMYRLGKRKQGQPMFNPDGSINGVGYKLNEVVDSMALLNSEYSPTDFQLRFADTKAFTERHNLLDYFKSYFDINDTSSSNMFDVENGQVTGIWLPGMATKFRTQKEQEEFDKTYARFLSGTGEFNSSTPEGKKQIDAFRERYLFNGMDNVDLIIPDTGDKSTTAQRFLSKEKYINQHSEDEYEKAKKENRVDSNGNVQLTEKEIEKNIEEIQKVQDVAVARTEMDFENGKKLMSQSMAMSLNLPISVYKESARNYKQLLKNYQNPDWVMKNGFSGNALYRKMLDDNPSLLGTDTYYAMVREQTDEIRKQQQNQMLLLNEDSYLGAAQILPDEMMRVVSEVTGIKAADTENLLTKENILKHYNEELGKTDITEKEKADLQKRIEKINNDEWVIAPSYAHGNVVGERSPSAWGTGVAAVNLAYRVNAQGKIEEDKFITDKLRKQNASMNTVYVPPKALYKMNTGDYDGDTVWLYADEGRAMSQNVEEIDKHIRDYQEEHGYNDEDYLEALPDAIKENVYKADAKTRRNASIYHMKSQTEMGIGSALIRDASQLADSDLKWMQYIKGMQYYDNATSNMMNKGVKVEMTDDQKKLLFGGRHFNRLIKNMTTFDNLDKEDQDSLPFESVFKGNLANMNDVNTMGAIYGAMMSGRVNGGLFTDDDSINSYINFLYGGKNEALYNAAMWYGQMYSDQMTGGRLINSEDIGQGKALLSRLFAAASIEKDSTAQAEMFEEANRLKRRLESYESDSMAYTQENVDSFLRDKKGDKSVKAQYEMLKALKAESEKEQVQSVNEDVKRQQQEYRAVQHERLKEQMEAVGIRATKFKKIDETNIPVNVTSAEPWFNKSGNQEINLSGKLKGRWITADSSNESEELLRNIGFNSQYRRTEKMANELIAAPFSGTVDTELGQVMHSAFEQTANYIRGHGNEVTEGNAMDLGRVYMDAFKRILTTGSNKDAGQTYSEFFKKQGLSIVEENGQYRFEDAGFLSKFKDENKGREKIKELNEKLTNLQSDSGVGQYYKTLVKDLGSGFRVAGIEGKLYNEKGDVTYGPDEERMDSVDISYRTEDGKLVSRKTHARPDFLLERMVNGKKRYAIVDYKSGREGAEESIIQSGIYQRMMEDQALKYYRDGNEEYKAFAGLIDYDAKTGTYTSNIDRLYGYDIRGGGFVGVDATQTFNGKNVANMSYEEYIDALREKSKDAKGGYKLGLDEIRAHPYKYGEDYSAEAKKEVNRIKDKGSYKTMNSEYAGILAQRYNDERNQIEDVYGELNKEMFKMDKRSPDGFDRFSRYDRLLNEGMSDLVVEGLMAAYGDDDTIMQMLGADGETKLKAKDTLERLRLRAATEDPKSLLDQLRNEELGLKENKSLNYLEKLRQRFGTVQKTRDALKDIRQDAQGNIVSDYYDVQTGKWKTDIDPNAKDQKAEERRAASAKEREEAYTNSEEDFKALGEQAAKSYDNFLKKDKDEAIKNIKKTYEKKDGPLSKIQERYSEVQEALDATIAQATKDITENKAKQAVSLNPNYSAQLQLAIDNESEKQAAAEKAKIQVEKNRKKEIRDLIDSYGTNVDKFKKEKDNIADTEKMLKQSRKEKNTDDEKLYEDLLRSQNADLARKQAEAAGLNTRSTRTIQHAKDEKRNREKYFKELENNPNLSADIQAQLKDSKRYYNAADSINIQSFKDLKETNYDSILSSYGFGSLNKKDFSKIYAANTNLKATNLINGLLKSGDLTPKEAENLLSTITGYSIFEGEEKYDLKNKIDNLNNDKLLKQGKTIGQYRKSRFDSQIARRANSIIRENENELYGRKQYDIDLQGKINETNKKIAGEKDPKKIAELTKNLNDYTKAQEENNKAMSELESHGKASAVFDSVSESVTKLMASFGKKMFRQALNDAKQFIKQFDQSMTNIQMITQKTDTQMSKLGDGFIKKAKDLKTSVGSVTAAATDLYRQGLSDEKVDERLDDIIKFSTVTGIKSDVASKIVTTAVNSGLVNDSQKAIDPLVALGDTAATTAAELAKGMQKSAGTAKISDVSYDELLTLLTIGTSKTQLGGNVIGTALNTIFSRLMKTANGDIAIDENGNRVSQSDVATSLKAAGIDIYETGTNKMRGAFDILSDLSKVWETLDDTTRSNIAYNVAGTRQRNNFETLMLGLSDEDLMEQYMGNSKNSSGITESKYKNYTESLAAANALLTASFDELVASVTETEGFVGFTDFLSGALQGVTAFNEELSGWPGKIALAATAFTALAAVVNTVNKSFAGTPIGAAITAIEIGAVAVAGIGALTGTIVKNVKENEYKENHKEQIALDEDIKSQQQRNADVNTKISEAEKLNKEIQDTKKEFAENGKEMNADDITDLTLKAKDLNSVLLELGVSSSDLDFKIDAESLQSWDDLTDKIKEAKDGYEQIKLDTIRTNSEQAMKAIDEKFKNGQVSFGEYQDVTRATFNEAGGWTGIARLIQQQGSGIALNDYMYGVKEGKYKDDLAKILYSLYGFEDKDYEMFNKKTGEAVSSNVGFDAFVEYFTDMDYAFRFAKDTADGKKGDFLNYYKVAGDIIDQLVTGNYTGDLNDLYLSATSGENAVAQKTMQDLYKEYYTNSFASSGVSNDIVNNLARMNARKMFYQMPYNFMSMTEEEQKNWFKDNAINPFDEYVLSDMAGNLSFDYGKYYDEYLSSGIKNPYENVTIKYNDGREPLVIPGELLRSFLETENGKKMFNEAYANGNVEMKLTEEAAIIDEEQKRAQLTDIDNTYKKNKKKNIDDLIELGNVINASIENEGRLPTITEMQEAGIEDVTTLMNSQAEFNNAYLRATSSEDKTMTSDRFKTISDLIVAKQTGLTRNLTQEEAQRILDLTEGMSAKERAEFFAADLSSVEQEAMKAAGFSEYFTESGNMTEEEMQAALDKLKLNEASLKDIAGYTENFGNISSYLTDTSAKGRMDTLAAMALSDAKLSEVQTAAENILTGLKTGIIDEGDIRKLAEYYGKDYETFMSNQGLMSSYAELAQGTVSNKDTAKALFEQMTGVTYDQWKDFENLSNEDFISKYGEDAFAAAYEGIDDTASNIMDIIEAEATTETPLSKALSQSQSARLQKAMPEYLGGLTSGNLDEARASMEALAEDTDKFEFASTNIDGFSEAFVDLNNAIETGDIEAAQKALKKIDDMKFMGLKEISDADVFNKIKDTSTLAELEAVQLEDAQMYQRINEVTGGYMLKRAQAEANGEDTSIYDALINDAIAIYKISKNTIDNQMLVNKGVVSSEVNNWTEMMRNGRTGEIGTSLLTSINGSRNKQAIYNKLANGKTLTREEQEYLAGQYNIDMDMYGANAGFYNGIFQNDVAMERARTEAGLAQALNDQTDAKVRMKAMEDLRNLGYEVTSNKETGKYNVSAANLYNGLTFDKQGVFTSAEILQAAQQALDQGDWTGIGEDLQKAVESNYKGVAEFLSYSDEQKISPSGQAVLKAAKDQLTQDAAATLLDETAEYYSESKSAYDTFATGTGKQRLDYAQNIMSQATSYANAQQALSSLDTNKAFEELDSTKLDYIEGVTGWGKNQIKKMWESSPKEAKDILAKSMKNSMETIASSLKGAITGALGDIGNLKGLDTDSLAEKLTDAEQEWLASIIKALKVSIGENGDVNVGGAEAEKTTLGDVITERKKQYVNQSNMMDTLRTISSGSAWWNKMGEMGISSDSVRAKYEQALINNPEIENIDQATLDILNKALGGETLTTEEQGALNTFIAAYEKEAKRNLEYKKAEGIALTPEEQEYEALQKQRELEGQEGLNDVDRAQLQRKAYESMMNGTYGKTFGISDEAMMNDIMSGNAKLAMFGVATTALEAQGYSMGEYLDLATLEEKTPEQTARFAEMTETLGGLNLSFSDLNAVATSLAGETLANLIEQTQMYGETSNQVADYVRKNTGTIDDQANALNDLYTQERKVQQLNSVMKAFESGSANKEFDSMFSGYSKQQRAQMLKEGKNSLQYKNLEKQRESAQHAYGQMLGQGASDYFKKSMGDGQQLVENLGGEAMDLEVPMTFNIKGGVITNVDMSAFDDGGDADVAAAAEELRAAGLAKIQEFLSGAGFVGDALLKLVVRETANGDTAAIDVAVEADSTANTTGNPSGGGGGGGGGKSSADLLIEKQQKASKLYEHKMKRLQTKAEDYEQLGEYTNLNEVLQTENDMMKRRMPDVKKNIKQLKNQMKHTKMGSDDWHKLRDALFAAEEEYDNLTKEIHANNKAMQENKKKILETYLALEEAASALLEAEEQKRREMISSRSQMEQQIFSDIQNRYNKEWSILQEDLEKKRQALQEESSLIDERLQRRKDAEDELLSS